MAVKFSDMTQVDDEAASGAGQVLVVVTPIKIFARDYN